VDGATDSQIYYPVTQQTPGGAQRVIRTSLPPAALAGSVLHALRDLNPNQPAAEFRPIRTIVDRAVSPRRFLMLLVGGFAALGLLLAALGISTQMLESFLFHSRSRSRGEGKKSTRFGSFSRRALLFCISNATRALLSRRAWTEVCPLTASR
jgi:hypothetical protein